ncbi:hypothetical protein THASP1DRAFT_24730, partial [Thamnocephalis sphaerospora]
DGRNSYCYTLKGEHDQPVAYLIRKWAFSLHFYFVLCDVEGRVLFKIKQPYDMFTPCTYVTDVNNQPIGSVKQSRCRRGRRYKLYAGYIGAESVRKERLSVSHWVPMNE